MMDVGVGTDGDTSRDRTAGRRHRISATGAKINPVLTERVLPNLLKSHSVEFEIVCWDSNATLLIGVEAEAAANFSRAFPDAKRLSEAPGSS
jgi:hypothetical protein